jgi:hypothetical protein
MHSARYRLIPSVSGSRPLIRGSNAEGEMIDTFSDQNLVLCTRRSSHSSSVIESASVFIGPMSNVIGLSQVSHRSCVENE